MYPAMGSELLGEILPGGQLVVCQGRAYSNHHKIAPHQVSSFFYGLHPD